MAFFKVSRVDVKMLTDLMQLSCAHLRFFGGHSQGQMGARNVFSSNARLSTIWRNE